MRFILLFLFIYFTLLEAQSQILNVERKRLSMDSSRNFIGNFSFQFTVNNRSAAQNEPVNFLSATGSTNLIYHSKKHTYWAIGYVNFFNVNDDPFIDNRYIHLRSNWLRKKKISYENFGQWQQDLIRGLNLRLLGGGGFRLNVFNKEYSELSLGIGVMYEYESWNNPITEIDVEIDLWKSANYITTRVEITENIEFNAIAYYQVGYDSKINDFRHRINGDANLLFKVTDVLSLNISFTGSYESLPVVPITPFIYAYTNGLQLRF